MLEDRKFDSSVAELKKCTLVLDENCEIQDLLWCYADHKFHNFSQHTLIPGAVYVIGRQQLDENKETIRDLVEKKVIRAVFSNPAEGASTIENHCRYVYNVADLIAQKKMLLIGGAEMSPGTPCLVYDHFLPQACDLSENIPVMNQMDQIYQKTNKPYKFLFLNGRFRAHRKYLIERFDLEGLLNQTIWSNLDGQAGPGGAGVWYYNGQDLMRPHRPIKLLDPYYEVDRYAKNLNNAFPKSFVKHELFNIENISEWGDIHLKLEPYLDTYFSMVTETLFDSAYSFRTEKIYKPIAMGHPWIVAANAGYYRDLRNQGFFTFGHLIDESFDQIGNHCDRANRIVEVVADLCRQDLASFLKECYTVCKYNQQLLIEKRPEIRSAFARRFFTFLTQYHFNE